jgi:hypothetical protein
LSWLAPPSGIENQNCPTLPFLFSNPKGFSQMGIELKTKMNLATGVQIDFIEICFILVQTGSSALFRVQ